MFRVHLSLQRYKAVKNMYAALKKAECRVLQCVAAVISLAFTQMHFLHAVYVAGHARCS